MINEFKGKYEFLSNFYPIAVPLGELWFPSIEHAYQAAKVKDHAGRQIFQFGTAAEAKKLGRSILLRDNWDNIKLTYMETLVRYKFAYPMMNLKLISTGDEELIEGNWWGDTFWGVCKGVGENHLGKILMRIREESK